MVFEAIIFLGVLILSAKFLGELMVRIKQPSIIGNVLAGIIIGPAVLAIVQPIEEIELFISIGIFFLFFLIGLEEIDLPGIFKILRRRLFLGSAVGFLVPFVAASLFSIYQQMNLVESFAIASVIGASSLGVTAKILTDLGKLKSTVGMEIFTVTAIVEFIAIIIAGVFIEIGQASTTSFEVFDFAWIFIKIIIFFGIAGGFAVFVFPKIMYIINERFKVKAVYFGIIVGVILVVAWFAEIMGLHGTIGALLLGIALSRMPKDQYLETSHNLHTIAYGVFIPIFFAGIGLYFVPNFIDLPIITIVGFLAIIIGVKFGGSYLAAKITQMKPIMTVTMGTMSKGAVDLALMLALLSVGLINEELFSLLVFGTLIMMVLSSVGLQRKLGHEVAVEENPQLVLMPLYFRRALSSSTAKDVMTENIPIANKDSTISEYVNKYLDAKKLTHLVIDENQKLLGAVSIREINKVSQKKWKTTKIEEVMNVYIKKAYLDDSLFSIVQKISNQHFGVIPVVDKNDKNKVLGTITKDQIMKLMITKKEK